MTHNLPLCQLLLLLLLFTCVLHTRSANHENDETKYDDVTTKDSSSSSSSSEAVATAEATAETAPSKLPINDLPKPMLLHLNEPPTLALNNDDDDDDDDDVAVLTNDMADDVYKSRRNPRSRRPTLLDLALQESVREGLDAMTQLYGKIQPDMIRNGQLLQDNHPAALLARFNAPSGDAVETERREMAAYATLSATKAFRKNYKLNNELARQSHNQKVSLRRTALEGLCPPRDPPTCMPASERYRTHDGTCNNKRRPRWGASQMPFNRFLPPEYGDGVDSVRSSTDGTMLSSSRFVSLLVHGAREGDAPLTLMIAQWGQLLDHDLTSTAQPRSINGSIPSCCGGKDFHPSCFPIKVPLDDPWLAPLKVRCLEFLRSAPAQRRDCVLSWREQTNQATSYLDASPIYSNSAKSSDNARTFRNGLLIYGRGNRADDVCQKGAIATQCIRAGDGRSGEQPGLLAMHHVWVGEHNRIATELSAMNEHWSDEKVYQETRRIVGAMFQHITYREFLPIVLGREVCKLFDLELLPSGYYTGYDPKVNPTVANAFSAAAFRFGHSLVQNSYIRCDRHHNVITNNVSLHEEFQRGDIGSAGSLHRLLRGLASQRALKRDEFITPELTNHLFQTPGFPFGLDLAAINIQRGRDHGIAPYTSWRVPCGLSAIHNWDDFANVVGPESARRIGHAYRSVHDIDLFVGGIAERPVVGGLVGPTFACIIAQQFSNSRKGDRFWYENGGFESSFTPAQLNSLRRVSLAQVLCRAVGGGTLQPHIFIPAEFSDNERLNCGVGSLAPLDLEPWLEQDPFAIHKPRPPVVESHVAPPERVFPNPVHVLKEDKAGFSNRVKPVTQATPPMSPPPVHKPNVDFVPNSSVGFQRPLNATKINDKLDIKRKPTTGNKRNTTPKPVSGVNNKLDKNVKNMNVRRRVQTTVQSTTRRTVIINNVPIELRSAVTADETKETTQRTSTTERTKTKGSQKTNKTTTTTKRRSTIKPHTRTETTKTVKSDTKENAHVANETKDTRKQATTVDVDPDDIDPMKQKTTPKAHKRVQRLVTEIKNFLELDYPLTDTVTTTDDKPRNQTVTKSINDSLTKTINDSLTKTINQTLTNRANNGPESKTLPEKKENATLRTTTTKQPTKQFKSTTRRGIELRSEYHSRPIYTRPQNVAVSGPNADQYEIEINIRQTNKNTVTKPVTKDYTTAYNNPYGPGTYESSYAPHYVDYPTTVSPSYGGYYQSPPTALLTQKRTKPPTIIYLNENDDNYQQTTTTRQPNIFQNLLTFATNSFNSHNWRPTLQPQVSQPSRDKPNYETIIINRPHVVSSSSSPSSSSQSYQPQSNGPISNAHFPVLTNSQIGVNPSSGFLHASSSAVSTGNFGTISGAANANGAGDSTFSFNIRPKPDKQQQPNTPYGSSYAPEYINLPVSTPQSDLYYDREVASPFSSVQQRPQNLNPYGRTPAEHKDAVDASNEVLHVAAVAEDKLDIRDFDYLSRTLERIEALTNLTDLVKTKDSTEVEEDDYQYDDDDDEDSNEVTITAPTKKFDQDGYLRPELMVTNLGKSESANVTQTIKTYLDDNYVLPVLADKTVSVSTEIPKPLVVINLDATTIQPKDFPDTLGKHLNNDIDAENTMNAGLTATTTKTIKRLAESVAFAPIKVLTEPERPDNWVIYETLNAKPPLPEPPIVQIDSLHTVEMPTPIRNANGLWNQDQLKKKKKTANVVANLKNSNESTLPRNKFPDTKKKIISPAENGTENLEEIIEKITLKPK